MKTGGQNGNKKPHTLLLLLALLLVAAAGVCVLFAGGFGGWRPVAIGTLALAAGTLAAFFVLEVRHGKRMWLTQSAQIISELKKLGMGEGAKEETTDPEKDELAKIVRAYANRMYETEYLKKQAEYDALQSQINPHFLYNTLDTIRGKAMEVGDGEVADMIECLSRIFRYSIGHKASILTLEEELENVRDYLKIQKTRFGNRFTAAFEIDEDDIDLLFCRVPKLILQPLVENAILHGLEECLSGGLVTIRAYRTRKFTFIQIEDNGQGIPREKTGALNSAFRAEGEFRQEDSGHGIALVNVNKRIQFYYGQEYGLTVYSAETLGTLIEICLPANGGAAYEN